jgi:hypothetical protein
MEWHCNAQAIVLTAGQYSHRDDGIQAEAPLVQDCGLLVVVDTPPSDVGGAR